MPIVVASAEPITDEGVTLDYTPTLSDATVSLVRVYTDQARVGTPVYTGSPLEAGGVWSATTPLADGSYFTAWDVTDSTGPHIDRDGFFTVLDGQVVPGSQVVSLDEVKGELGKTQGTGTFTGDDRELAQKLQAAVEVAEVVLGRSLTPRTFVETHDDIHGDLWLHHYPVLSVLSVSEGYLGATPTAYATADVQATARNGRLRLLSGAAWYGDVTVTYTAGMRESTVPARWREAIRVIAAHLWSSQRPSSNRRPQYPGEGPGEQLVMVGGYAIPHYAAALLTHDERGWVA